LSLHDALPIFIPINYVNNQPTSFLDHSSAFHIQYLLYRILPHKRKFCFKFIKFHPVKMHVEYRMLRFMKENYIIPASSNRLIYPFRKYVTDVTYCRKMNSFTSHRHSNSTQLLQHKTKKPG